MRRLIQSQRLIFLRTNFCDVNAIQGRAAIVRTYVQGDILLRHEKVVVIQAKAFAKL